MATTANPEPEEVEELARKLGKRGYDVKVGMNGVLIDLHFGDSHCQMWADIEDCTDEPFEVTMESETNFDVRLTEVEV